MSELSQLEKALTSPERVEESLTPSTFGNLAMRVEELLSLGTVDELKALEGQLAAVFKDRLRRLSTEARGQILDRTAGDAMASFEAGRLSFAHLLVSQVAVRRAPERLAGQVRKKAFARYVEALRAGEKSNQELIDLVQEADATVSRKLRLLRTAGITGFRKEGRSVLNFLTTAALAAVGGTPRPGADSRMAEADKIVWRYNTAAIRDVVPENRRNAPAFKGHPTSEFPLPRAAGRR